MIFLKVTQVACDRAGPGKPGPQAPLPQPHGAVRAQRKSLWEGDHKAAAVTSGGQDHPRRLSFCLV